MVAKPLHSEIELGIVRQPSYRITRNTPLHYMGPSSLSHPYRPFAGYDSMSFGLNLRSSPYLRLHVSLFTEGIE